MNQKIRVGFSLCLTAAIPRLLGAFFLPNTFGDAYVYVRDIGNLSTKIKSGTFAIPDLYGFWLPLYQLISGFLNVFVGNGFYAGKIVSAVFGVGVSLLVYVIALQVTAHGRAALLAFLLIALNPLHILNSASAMTDVPHAFFVIACLYFVLQRKWMVAAVLAALAGLTRVESWMLIALIPALQIWRERRVSIPAMLVTLIAPLFWFWVSWKATGDWLACFRTRRQYHDWLLAQNPALGKFSVAGVLKDSAMLLSGADAAVLIGALVAGGLVLSRLIRNQKAPPRALNTESIVPLLVFFFAFFALLSFAYLTHQQPIIFPRYGLILFSLGIPILAWTYFAIVKRCAEWSNRLFAGIAVLCVLNASAQFAGGAGELNRYAAQKQAADYLRAHFDPKSNAKIFCDEGTVRALTGIRNDGFVTSAEAPLDDNAFIRFLVDQNVTLLVYVKQPGSTFARVFPDAESAEADGFDLVLHTHSNFLPMDIWLFERRKR